MNMQAKPEQVATQSAEQKLPVLIVDDSPTERMRLVQLLQALGHSVVAAVDGVDALEKMEERPYQLIISDQTMPRMDGRELCRRLRNTAEYQQPYIIMLTANGEHDDLVAGMDAGADDFLSKPAHKEELRVRLAAGERTVRMRNAIELQNEALREAQQQNERELALAAKLQNEYVPSAQWLSPTLQLSSHFSMTRGIGGDSMGVISPKPGQSLLYQIDVMGHGIASAMLSFALQNAIQQMLGYHVSHGSMPPLHQICRRLNERFPSERFSGLYFTMLLALIDENSDKLSYCQAGHPHPCVLSPEGEMLQVNRGSFPIGLFDFADYETRTLPFMPGSLLMLSSDGLFDVLSPAGETLGRESVEKLLTQNVNQDAETLLERLVSTKRAWQKNEPLADDVSVLLVKRSLSGQVQPAIERPLVLTLQPTETEAGETIAAIEAHLKLLSISEALIARIQTTVAELLNNYVEHASWEASESSPYIELSLKSNGSRIEVVISEYAAPIPHLCPPKPMDLLAESGRGYHILLNWVDNIQTERANDQNSWILQYKNSL
ncbi:MAG: SpoIIE family protein phosphatase [Oceanospirillaceae bacterium]|nr:SpoIIE family protein phosphatase [Oceanospirillaceae bacterium]